MPILNPLVLMTLLVLILAAQGCTQSASRPTANTSSQPTLARCCTDMEDYPRWFVDVSRAIGPPLGTVLSHITWRSGHLRSKQAAQKAILAEIRPLDIVLVSSKGRKSGQVIPGLFGHAAIYLGTRAELEELGVWTSAEVKPHAAGIRADLIFIEADAKGVHLSPSSVVLNTDRVAILRPALRSPARRRQVARAYFDAIGTDFDFLFDVDSPDCTFCTELIHRVMPELTLPVQEIYGVRTILPDRVAVAALRYESDLEFVDYIKAAPDTWRQASGQTLADDIAAIWSNR
ncbi:YiiX/YebB-like N1pC/P60 family cysteine hydrolase [Hoeflea sp.]|uniref:YiiX/YebB-like N1pC/P60 family cysteine hydrolase n=1 Tax=Hoeflea sp. TaxID=1940281 RepID=UPI001982BE2C|nr:YiiX/YebB-like N1pC/P60 family cysteine hydrolase [Hoeflea sp.]MBC7283347.1 hypothetical protein [Hoeflea sp.]